MAKDSIRDYSATSSDNSDIQSVDISEGCAPSGLNNAIREVMTDLKNVSTGTVALETPVADSFSTDTISEKTSATGVTIDGVLLKDGAIGSIANAVAAHLTSINGGQIGGSRNLIINGAMQVAQRGTSFTDADTYALDRWRVNQSAETMAVTQQSFAVGQTDVPRAEKYLRVVVTTTGNFAGITQRIEGVEQLSGQTVTVSFYARGGQGGQGVPTTFRTYMNQNFGSGGSTAVNGHGSTNFTLTTSWQLFTATITLNSVSGQTIGTSPYTELAFQQTTGEACDFDIALVQLEIGDVATPFEHESYAATLQKCQRYFQKRVFSDADAIWVGANFNATSSYGVIEHIVTMRTEPSGAYSGTLADYKYYSAANTKTPSTMTINSRNSENSSETHIDWSGDLNSGGAGWLRAVGTNAFVQLEAEL